MPVGSKSSFDGADSVWTGGGLHREVFFFDSSGVRLYGSLYVAAEPSRPFGVVACNSWGVEADRCDPLQRSVALRTAQLGGAGLVFHYPGYGDSYGELAGVSLEDLAAAALDALAEGRRRCPEVSWMFAGVAVGAAVACLAGRRASVKTLLLLQPALRPGAYFRRLAERTEPLAPGSSPREMLEAGATPGMAYGYPLPRRVLDRADAIDTAVAAELAAFDGRVAAIRHTEPQAEALPPRFEEVTVRGPWRFGAQNHPQLAAAAAEWLGRWTAPATSPAPRLKGEGPREG